MEEKPRDLSSTDSPTIIPTQNSHPPSQQDKKQTHQNVFLANGQSLPELKEKTLSKIKEPDTDQLPLNSKKKCDILQIDIQEAVKQKIQGTQQIKVVSPSPKTGSASSREDKKSKEQSIGSYLLSSEANLEGEAHDLRVLEEDSNDLPLNDILKLGYWKKRQQFCSSESDISEYNKNYSEHPEKRNPLGQSFFSQDAPENDAKMKKCSHCSLLRQSNNKIKAEKSQFEQQLVALKKQCLQLKKFKKNAEAQDSQEDEEADPLIFSHKLMKKISKIHRDVNRMKKVGFQQVVTFAPGEDDLIPEVIQDLKYLMKYINKEDKYQQEEQKLIEKLHKAYQKIIQNMKNKHEQQVAKVTTDLKNFIDSISKSPKRRSVSATKQVQVKKMTSMYISTQDLQEQICQVEQLKDRIDQLQKQLKEEKKISKKMENAYRNLYQKYQKQMFDKSRQQEELLKKNKKIETQFQIFMQKITQTSLQFDKTNKIFFNNISQRIFQISNCIPFQDNDDQNLFTPDNEEQLLDMIQRIRRFALKLQQYRDQKDRNQINMKKQVTNLFKQLVLMNQLSIQQVIDTIKSTHQEQMDYLKIFLFGLKEKLSKKNTLKADLTVRNIKPKKSLSLSKVDSITFNSKELKK